MSDQTDSMPEDPDRLLKATEVATRLRISKTMAYWLIQQGEIPSVNYGGHTVRVKASDLESFIDKHRTSKEIEAANLSLTPEPIPENEFIPTKSVSTETVPASNSSHWGVVELLGNRVVAGFIQESKLLGKLVIRIDVPATKRYPAFTQFYGESFIFCVSFTTEHVARLAAEDISLDPAVIVGPDLVPGPPDDDEEELPF